MATTISEFFGYRAQDRSPEAELEAIHHRCPFIAETCEKRLHDGTPAGVCSLKPAKSSPVICCPQRLYADDYRILHDVAAKAFGSNLPLHPGGAAMSQARRLGAPVVAVFGKKWGGELRLPQRRGTGGYFVDWILAKLSANGSLEEFVAVEVQTIDTTGNYKDARVALLDKSRRVQKATAGFNWENVNKRIIPQLLYKGNVLQREALCRGGLFFVIPVPVYSRILDRLGGRDALLQYPLQSSSLTFMAYDLDLAHAGDGNPTPLKLESVFTTNIGQVAQAFAGPGVMPPQNVYAQAIREALDF